MAHHAVLSATGLFTPPHRISNDELVSAFNTWVHRYNTRHADAIAKGEMEPKAESSSAFIVKASGIESRYVMDKQGILDPDIMHPLLPQRPDDALSLQAEISVAAARDALATAGLEGKDIDMIVVACSNLMRPYPAVSIEIQAALGAQGFAYDMNVACSSATFGLQAAADAIANGTASRALVINPEICTAHLNFCDRDSHFIFGDAATAILLERDDLAKPGQGFNILGTALWTQFSNNIRNNFGFLNHCDPEHQFGPDKLFVQQGRKVFREVSPAVGEHIVAHLQKAGVAPEALKRLWLHQANRSMNDLIGRRVLGRDATADEAPIILDSYANTSSAGCIIALHLHQADLVRGDKGIICSFGAGYSVGSVLVEKR